MKKYFVLLVGVVCGFFASCSDDNAAPNVGGEDADSLKVEALRGTVASADTATYTVDEYAAELTRIASEKNDDEADSILRLRDNLVESMNRAADSIAQANGVNFDVKMLIRRINYEYWTRDQNKKAVKLSATVMWTGYWLFGQHDNDPSNMVLFEHYTISDHDDAPSESWKMQTLMELIAGSDLIIAPDLMGYGCTRDSVHPYINHELTAINSVDAMEAGYDVFKKYRRQNTDLKSGWGLYVIGCSQGGSSALAVQKYLDQHPLLASEYHFKASICASGPYSPEITIKEYMQSEKGLGFPFVIPMTLKSMMFSYPSLFKNYKESDFYTDDYNNKAKETIDKMFKERNCSNDDISKKIASLLGKAKDDVKITDIFNKSVITEGSDLYNVVMESLKRNDLTTGWTPTHRIYLKHGKADDVVPYANAEAVYHNFGKSMVSLVYPVNLNGHTSACITFLYNMYNNGYVDYVEKYK